MLHSIGWRVTMVNTKRTTSLVYSERSAFYSTEVYLINIKFYKEATDSFLFYILLILIFPKNKILNPPNYLDSALGLGKQVIMQKQLICIWHYDCNDEHRSQTQ